MKRYMHIGLLVSILVLVNAACKRTLPSYGQTAVVKMANNWWVTAHTPNNGYYKDGNGSMNFFFATYNSSSNAVDSLWLDDLENGYGIKTEVTADYTNFTFSSTASYNLYLGDSVTVFNGKILLNGGHSASGVVVDSIYFQALFSDDPGDTLTMAGVARTGFDQDEYP
jgi:hypothetical protein